MLASVPHAHCCTPASAACAHHRDDLGQRPRVHCRLHSRAALRVVAGCDVAKHTPRRLLHSCIGRVRVHRRNDPEQRARVRCRLPARVALRIAAGCDVDQRLARILLHVRIAATIWGSAPASAAA